MLMTSVRFILVLMIAMAACARASLGEDPARAQVAAATANALGALRSDIRSARITPTLTVAQFLDRTNAADLFDDTIEQAQQIGAPRWVDDQTCQVQLELSGAKVAYSLVSIAAARSRLSPLPAEVLERRLEDWKQRSFSATGTSVSAARVPGIRPFDVGERWSSISDDARSQALAAARQDAAQHVLDDIRPISLNNGQTVGDIISREPVQKAVRNWVASQPVTQVRFGEDLQVELTVATPPDELLATINQAAKAEGTTLPADAKSVDELQREFSRRAPIAVGRASVSGHPISTREVINTIDLPSQLPMWVGSLLDAEGTSPATSTALRTKTAAETKATENLHARINSLPLTRSMTLGEAAKEDVRISDAINRTLLRARVYKVEYAADRSISVRMSIDSRDLWSELRQAVGQ